MSRYRKKPLEINAMQLVTEQDVALAVGWVKDGGWFASASTLKPSVMKLATLEGDMFACMGDWIIRGVKGEFYPCKPDVFEASYEAVESE